MFFIGRIVLVIGFGGGIGFVIVVLLVEGGCRIVGIDWSMFDIVK